MVIKSVKNDTKGAGIHNNKNVKYIVMVAIRGTPAAR